MATHNRISNLPDELLLHILSFLPKTKDRAKTSLISRRWRHLWTHCPSLHFSLPISFDPLVDMDAIAQNYIAAVDTCLLSFKPLTLDHLSLDLWLPTSCPPASAHANSRVADRWLRFAGVRSARSLSVQAWTKPGTWNGYTRIPGSLFSCRALTDLHVSFSTFPAVPANFRGFHSLKKLVLGCGAIADQNLADLLARCPLLEDIAIVGLLDLQFVKISHIELPKLRRLHLMCDQLEETAAVIEAPNLEYFRFCGDLDELEWNGSVVLREAVIKNCSGNVFHMQDVWMKLLFAISSVSVLTVNEWFFQFVIPKEAMLKNLKELKCNLDWVTGLVLHALVSNLKECPMLEKLCIDFNYEPRAEVKDSVKKVQGVEDDLFFLHTNVFLKTTEDNHEEDGFDIPAHILELGQPLCHLRTVTLNEFMGSKNEMCLVKFLLGSAPLLEEFIVLDFLARGKGRTEEELELLFAPIPRASSKVQMKLSQYENFLIFLKVWGERT